MEIIFQFLAKPLFSYSEHTITVGQVLLFPAIILLAWVFFRKSYKFMTKRLERSELPPDMILLLQRIYVIVVLIVVVLIILDMLKVPLGAFAFISGAIAIGVGFGAQNIINNFISGWILMWERPIRIGDFLEIGDAKGTVETINTRSTRIRRTDGVHMLVPNSQLLENMVVNWTLMDKKTRSIVRVGVAYGSPVKLVADLIMKATDEHPETMDDPKPVVFFEDFGDNALIFDSYFWIDAAGERDLRKVRSEVRFRIAELFDEAGIVIAFPQRDVHIDGELKIIEKDS
ncbi:MAG: mechanosensitive ion channel [Gammaproteobacteria bacterium]|jgi:small-conductance mechanosensitive channel|nr:mechanosensitive ion channel [Gammaproteobacteria bacterium]MBT6043327.1 mechanosensitive ion channel [Gammaproteobacteria bacterium]